MDYTIQLHTESGNFAPPQPNDVIHCSSRNEIKWELEAFQDMVHQFDNSKCEATVYIGNHLKVVDLYPDQVACLSPRGRLILKYV